MEETGVKPDQQSMWGKAEKLVNDKTQIEPKELRQECILMCERELYFVCWQSN